MSNAKRILIGLTDGPNDQSAIAIYLMWLLRTCRFHSEADAATGPAMKLLTKKRSAGKRHQQRCKKEVLLIVVGKKYHTAGENRENTEVVIEKLADYTAKCVVPGKAQCLYRDDTISDGSRGCVGNYSLGSTFAIEISTKYSIGLNAGALTEHITRPSSTYQPLAALALHNIKLKIILINFECL